MAYIRGEGHRGPSRRGIRPAPRASAAMFGILDRLLLRGPLHVRDASDLRRVISTTQPPGRGALRTGHLGYVSYETFRADDRAFVGVAAYNLLPDGVMLGERESARPINRGSATAAESRPP